jgi:hypothetical protein
LKISAARLDVLVWSLVYGGLLTFALGFALERQGHAYGRVVMLVSALAVVVGVVLLWRRSRLPDA